MHRVRLVFLMLSDQGSHASSSDSQWSFATVLACLLVLCNRVFCENVCRLCPLIVTDIVDENMFVSWPLFFKNEKFILNNIFKT